MHRVPPSSEINRRPRQSRATLAASRAKKSGGSGTGESEMERWFEGKSATETFDGRVIYIKNDRTGIFARLLAGDPTENLEERLVDDIRGPIGYFAAVEQVVYYTGQDVQGGYLGLLFFNYAHIRIVEVAPRSITGPVNSLTVTPYCLLLVYTQNPKAVIDLTLIQFQDR